MTPADERELIALEKLAKWYSCLAEASRYLRLAMLAFYIEHERAGYEYLFYWAEHHAEAREVLDSL